jgi:RNA polymerase sigma-70 factor (ECF subfamily)
MRLSSDEARRAEQIWAEYGPALSRTLRSYEADPHLCEDLAQNVFLALLTSLERIAQADNPKAYIFRIAHNVATDHVCKAVKIPVHEPLPELLDSRRQPERLVEKQDERQRLLAAVRQLALPYRQVIVLLLEGMGQEDIGTTLGISPGNVRIRISRAKTMLKEILQEDEPDE